MNKKLYVGNLSYQTTDVTLSDLFGAVGEVVSVSLITDRMTGRSRGFRFRRDGGAECCPAGH